MIITEKVKWYWRKTIHG